MKINKWIGRRKKERTKLGWPAGGPRGMLSLNGPNGPPQKLIRETRNFSNNLFVSMSEENEKYIDKIICIIHFGLWGIIFVSHLRAFASNNTKETLLFAHIISWFC